MSGTLEVLVGATRVGVLEQFEDEEYVFTFDGEWLVDPDRPVLGQLFEDRKPVPIQTSGPPCWFAHLLPQGPLRRALSRQLGVDEGDVFAFLQAMGDDLPGAVVARPIHSAPSRRTSAPPEPPEAGLKMSALAGAQWKLSVRPGERGLVLPVQGATGSWIAKFHDPNFSELPRVEFATMCWAALSGIRVPPLRLGRITEIEALPAGIPTGDGTMYLVERFDRAPDERRIHMEDMGQVLDRPPGHRQYDGSYEQLAAVLGALAPSAVREFCERLVFCIVCGNTDAHLKNWSVLYPDGRQAELSPAYDLVASVLYMPRVDDELALELDGARAFDRISLDTFKRMAAVTNSSFAELGAWVREAASRTVDAWHAHAAELAYTDDERRRLTAHMARIPLLTAS